MNHVQALALRHWRAIDLQLGTDAIDLFLNPRMLHAVLL